MENLAEYHPIAVHFPIAFIFIYILSEILYLFLSKNQLQQLSFFLLVVGIIGGVVFGLIFAAFYNKLPGSKPIVNAFLIAIIYWLIFSVITGLFFKLYYLALYGITYIVDVTIGLIMYLFWGFLFVSFWNKFSKKQKSI